MRLPAVRLPRLSSGSGRKRTLDAKSVNRALWMQCAAQVHAMRESAARVPWATDGDRVNMKARNKAGRPNSARAPVLEGTYTLLKEMIADRRIKPGERLREAQIANAFAISRSPASGALALLLAEKLVVADGGIGFRVAGKATAGAGGAAATLKPIRIEVPRRWERMYEEVERDLLVQLLFGSVRINEL